MSGRVSLWFAHGTRNVGDVALNVGVSELLAGAGFQLDAAVLPSLRGANLDAAVSSLPSETRTAVVAQEAMSVDSLREYSEHPERLFRNYGVDGLDTVLLHAGEHLYAPADLAAAHPLALWRILPGLAALATGRRLVILPSTFGPFAHARYGRLIAELIGAATAVAARDAVSADVVSRFRREGVPALLDPAFFIEPESAPARRVGRVALSMRLEGFGLRAGAAASERAMEQQVATGFRSSPSFTSMMEIGAILRADPRVSGLTLVAQTSSDLALMEAADRELRALGGALDIELVDVHRSTPRAAQAMLAGHDLVLTSRFHGIVLALAAGTPAGGLPLHGHGHKIPGLYRLLGEEDWAVSPERVAEPDALQGLIDRVRDAERAERVGAAVDRARADTIDWLSAALEAPAVDARRRARRALRLLAELAQARQSPLARG